MDKVLKELSKTRNKEGKYKLRSKKPLFSANFPDEMKILRKELKQREAKTISEIIKSANVILATNVGAADKALKVSDL
jgi:hypothetical protein